MQVEQEAQAKRKARYQSAVRASKEFSPSRIRNTLSKDLAQRASGPAVKAPAAALSKTAEKSVQVGAKAAQVGTRVGAKALTGAAMTNPVTAAIALAAKAAKALSKTIDKPREIQAQAQVR